MKKLLLMLLMLMIAVQGYAGTTNYNWIYIPKYPDAESANYPTYMDNFMDDVDVDMWGLQQNKLTADTTAPITPTCNTPTTGVETNTDGTAITWLNMSWASIGDSGLREYEVRVKKDAETNYTYAYTDGLSVRMRPAFAGSTYYFDVRAIDKQGNAGSYCTPVSVVAAQDSSAPTVPSGLSLSTGISQDNNGISYVWLQADWTANSEKDVASYKIRIKEGVGGSYYYSTSNSNTLRFINLKPNTAYYVGIKAVDASGNESNYSTDSNLTSGNDASAPTAPVSLIANSGFQIIWLTWTASSSIDVHKYEIYRSATNNVASASKVGETPGITYPDDDLPNDISYYYWVRAVDDFGNPSAWSNSDTAGATATTSLIHNVDVFADLSALKITSAELKSTNWSTTAGSLYDIDDGAFYIGGSTNPKLSWNGTTLTVKGNVSVESGQTFTCTDCVSGTAVGFNYATSGSEGGNATNTDSVGTQAASAVNTGVSRATTGLNALGQATQLLDTTNLPVIASGASRVVIGNEGIKMFNASSLERVNINTDGTFRFGNSAGDNLYWNGSTLVLTGRATIATSADSATNATNAGYATSAGSATTATTAILAIDVSCSTCVSGAEVTFNYADSASKGGSATNSNDLSCTDCVADTELNNIIDLGAGGVTVRSNNANNKVQLSSSGIYGYNTSGTQTFGIDSSNGNAYFGPAGNQLSYVNGVLTVPGGVVTSGINADYITAGTITGRTLQTAASPNPRIELSANTRKAKWFTDATTLIASIGVYDEAVGSDYYTVYGSNPTSGQQSGTFYGGFFSVPNDIYYASGLRSGIAVGGSSVYGIGASFYGGRGNISLPYTSYSNSSVYSLIDAPGQTILTSNVGTLWYNHDTSARWNKIAMGVVGKVTARGSNGICTVAGSGYSCYRNTGAIYNITFSPAMLSAPYVIATAHDSGSGVYAVNVNNITASGFDVHLQASVDKDFSFFAILPY